MRMVYPATARWADGGLAPAPPLGQTGGHQAEVGANCRVGPFAVLEAGSQIPSGTTTGSFYTATTAAGLDD